jgi:hypothetical protein
MTENWKKLKRLEKINEEMPLVHRELMKLIMEGMQIIDELGLGPVEIKKSTGNFIGDYDHIITNMNMNMSKKNKTEIN